MVLTTELSQRNKYQLVLFFYLASVFAHATIFAEPNKPFQDLIAYSAVSGFEIMAEPFAKTPKGSIRRFLYR